MQAVDYTGDRTLDDLIKFVEDQLNGTEMPEEDEDEEEEAPSETTQPDEHSKQEL